MFTTAQVVFIKAKIAFNYSHTITWYFFLFQGSATVGLKSKTHAIIVALKVS